MLNISRILLGEILFTWSSLGGGIMMTEFLNRIDSYLLGEGTLRYLEEWLLSNLQNIIDSADQKAIDLANWIDADLIELSEGLIDEATIREYLQRYVMDSQTVSLHYGQLSRTGETVLLTVSAASSTVKSEFPITLVEDYRFQAVFV